MMNMVSQFPPKMAPPTARWMGMEVIEHRPDEKYTKVSFQTNGHMINFGGVIQGGFLTAMMDDATGFNTFIALKMQQSMASINLNTQFFKAVRPGILTVEAWVVRTGKSVAFVEAKLYDEDGELSAAFTSSVKLRPFTGLQYEMENNSDG